MRTLRQAVLAAMGAAALGVAGVGGAAAAPLTGTVWYTSDAHPIDHWETRVRNYTCPSGQHIGDPNRPWDIPFSNASSDGVSAALAGGGYQSDQIVVGFTNWNWWGDQTFRVAFVCH